MKKGTFEDWWYRYNNRKTKTMDNFWTDYLEEMKRLYEEMFKQLEKRFTDIVNQQKEQSKMSSTKQYRLDQVSDMDNAIWNSYIKQKEKDDSWKSQIISFRWKNPDNPNIWKRMGNEFYFDGAHFPINEFANFPDNYEIYTVKSDSGIEWSVGDDIGFFGTIKYNSCFRI